MKKLIIALRYTAKSAVFLWKRGKLYLFLILLSTCIEAITPFPQVYLAKYSVDLLVQKVKLSVYISTLAGIIAIILALPLIQSLLGSITRYVKDKLYTKIRLDICDICLYTDWGKVQYKSFIEKKDFALKVLN